jgi:crotonobetainyl-CoA:carnitine CoA-transferase CaiB-like acyl-CoA transferase
MGGTVSAMAVLAALWHKRTTGRGQHVNISMHDIMGWVGAESWPLQYSGKEPMRDGNRHFVLAPQNVFEAQDGLVAIAVENEKQWNALCRLIGRTEGEGSFSYARMKDREEEMENRIAAWMKGKNRDEAVAACQEMKIPAGPVLEIGEVAEHPHSWAREMIVELERTGGERIKLLGSPFHMSLTPGIMESTAPLLGEHTGEVLRDVLGYSDEELRRLQEEGVILMADG